MDESDDSKLKEEVRGSKRGRLTKEKQQKEIKESYKMGIEYYEEVEEEIDDKLKE